MRLHELEITAFGPFAQTVVVDFDELSAGGLFLLTGATGAGKTSILDAVCFALYGAVPGDRAGAKHLRSDHASPQAAPEVRLRFSVGEREFTFTRSPAWSRPKLRGNGETRVQAHVHAEELRSGQWVSLTNRLDDAGLIVTDLLGMTSTQFTQVALLPQGRFQAFLRATSVERHAVLQKLFRTDRFERVEQWLVDQRTLARRAAEAGAAVVGETLNRLREAAGIDLAEADSVADGPELRAWIDELGRAAAVESAVLMDASTAADATALAAQSAWESGRRTHELQIRGAAARADLAVLADQEPELALARRRLQGHLRARPLAALVTARAAATRTATRCSASWEHRRAELASLLDSDLPIDRPLLAQACSDARAAHTLALAFAPRAEAQQAAEARIQALRTQLQGIESGVAELELTLAAQPAVIAESVAAVHEARAAAARLPVVMAAVERWDRLVVATNRAELVGLELVAARTDVLEATATAQAVKEHYLDVREARINGMAGELAGQLASGCSCPVCGSADHPAPAASGSSSTGRADEDDARRASENAAFEVQARQVGLATLEGELAGLEEQLAGVERTELRTRLEAARDEAERLEPLVAALDVLVAREQAVRARLAAAEDARATALLERATLTSELEQTAATAAAIGDERRALHDLPGAAAEEDPGLDLTELIALRGRRAALLDEALASLEAATQAQDAVTEATDRLAEAASAAGFDDLDVALAALLDERTAAATAEVVRDAELRAHAAALTTADPDIAAALDTPAPELDALRATAEHAEQQARAAGSARDAAAARHTRTSALTERLEEQLEAWSPLRARHQTIAGLAALVEGKSVDNPLRMRLAAYVLAERLRQVVAAANERLAQMTDQRYALEHSDDRGFGEQRGGLSLRVRDEWNGVRRDPATLSGGETFVVSLALALGLADTVAHEAGGTDIDTLFIDEGFGSLDADTLEDVMDTLDSLRDGGRVVGLVSHVAELRSRIPTQLEVAKTRSGSTVRAAFTTA
jgi:exonuclease SbcC